MKRIVILGNSPAGLTAIEHIMQRSKDFTFTIVSYDGTLPASRESYARLIGKNIKASEFFLRNKNYFDTNKIELILDKKINRVNFNRKKIFTEDKAEIDYDILLITSFPSEQWPEIKGTNKTGTLSFYKTKNILDCHEMISIAESVVIESQRPEGFVLALAYAANKKHTSLVTKKEWLLPAYFSKDASDALISHLTEHELNIYTANEIGEILGEGDAKAVRLKSNKVLAGEAIFLADVMPDAKFVKGTPVTLGERIIVDKNGKTNLADVYALDLANVTPGTCAGKFKHLAALIKEGTLVAGQILGEELPLETSFSALELNTPALSICIFGEAMLGSDSKEKFTVEPLCYKRIMYHQGKAVGAVLINAQDKKELFEKYLNNQIDWSQIEGEFTDEMILDQTPENSGTAQEAAAREAGDASAHEKRP